LGAFFCNVGNVATPATPRAMSDKTCAICSIGVRQNE
jgi:hypothetical protein